MENKPIHIDFQSALSHLMKAVELEVPIHFTSNEENLFSVFLSVIGFSTIEGFSNDIEVFLKEEIDFESITRDNVSTLNLNVLASKFGRRYRLPSLEKIVAENEIVEIQALGWKATRIIMVTVLKPELQSLPFEDAQRLVLTLHDFIESYSIIQGVRPSFVMKQLQFWDIFNEFKFTLELDNTTSIVLNQPDTDEFIIWTHEKISIEKIGELIEHHELIVSKNHWIEFFENHVCRIEVVKGNLQTLVAVLFQLEQNGFFGKNKNKGCWKIWQMILVDGNNKPFSRELRKISSKINRESTDKDKRVYEFAKGLIDSLSDKSLDNR